MPILRDLFQVALWMVVFWFNSCSFSEKAPQLDPFAAINPFQKFSPLAPDSPLAASVVSQWAQEFSQPNFLAPGDYWHSRQGRNELVYRLIFIADYRFFRYEGDLMAGRAAGDTIVDMAVLGLSAAGALTTPGQATQILAAISGGLIGSRAAVQKNFFQNQTTAVLLDRMRALRQERFNDIVANLKLSPEQYPVELAIVQIFDYFNRGTMLGALQDISKNTAIKQIQAEGGDVTTPHLTPPVNDQIRLSLPQSIPSTNGHLNTTSLPPEVRSRKKRLIAKIALLQKNHDVLTASKILGNFGVSAPPDDSALTELSGRVKGISSENELIPLEHAFNVTLGQTADQGAPLPQGSATPTPTPSNSIPTSTPKDVPGSNGSLGS